MSTAHTIIEMTAKRGSTATLDRGQHFKWSRFSLGTISFDEIPARAANKIGHL